MGAVVCIPEDGERRVRPLGEVFMADLLLK